MHKERFTHLITVMLQRQAEEKNLEMDSWIEDPIPSQYLTGPVEHDLLDYATRQHYTEAPRVLQDGFCATTACMGGWAALDPDFRAQGLKIIVTSGGHGRRPFPMVAYGGKTCWEAMAKFLQIPNEHADMLFSDSGLAIAYRAKREWSNDFDDAIRLLRDYLDDPQKTWDEAYDAYQEANCE